jgi:hypothetical protein
VQALAYAKLGMKEPGQAAMTRLLALRPEYPSQVSQEISRWLSPSRTEEVLGLLQEVGLDLE